MIVYISMLSFADFMLNEMLLHKLDAEADVVIAWRQHLWLLTWANEKKHGKKIIDTILKDHPRKGEIQPPLSWKRHGRIEYDDVTSWVSDEIKDAVVGQWDQKTKSLHITNSINPVSSPLVKKVAFTLGARQVTQEPDEDNSFKYKKKELVGNFPKQVFHGTSTKYLRSILSTGIQAGQGQSNYPNIAWYEDRVFFSTTLSEAQHHAIHTAQRTNAWPIVFAVQLPDPSRIEPDFDVDTSAGQTSYQHNIKASSFYSVNPLKASKQAGLLAYKGRVPANFIDYISILNSAKKWVKIPKSRFKSVLNGMNNQGDDYFYMRYGEPSSTSKRDW